MKSRNLTTFSFLIICVAIIYGQLALGQQTSQNITNIALSKSDCPPNNRFIDIPLNVQNTNISIAAIAPTTDLPDPNYRCPASVPSNTKTTAFTPPTLRIDPKDILGSACTNTSGVTGFGYLCIYNDSNVFTHQINYAYDTTPLSITLSATSGEYKQVTLHIDDGGKNVGSYEVCYQPLKYGPIEDPSEFEKNKDCTEEEDGWPKKVTATSSTKIIEELENNTEYVFKARVKAASDWSPSVKATPSDAYSFADIYEPRAGGCNQSQNPISSFALWGFLGFILLGLRKAKSRFQIKPGITKNILLVFLLFAANFASADLGQLNLTIKGTPYLPNFDASQNKAGAISTPFKCAFGSPDKDPLLPLMGLDLDVHLTDAFGSLQIGGGIAYTYASGHALSGLNTCEQTKSDVGLHLFQIKFPQITYIFDPWIESVPFAPYIRAGLIGAGYIATFQGKIDSKDEAGKPIDSRPFTVGFEAAAGLLFLLDVLEPKTAAQTRGLGYIDHTYLKAEVAYAPLNNFGRGGVDLSSAWPSKTLPLMLNFGLVFAFP